MKFIIYNAEAIALFLGVPDWNEDFNVDLDLSNVTAVDKAVTGKRSPRKFAASTRFAFEFSVFCPPTAAAGDDAAYSTRMRLWLQQLKGETVAVPMWTDAVELYSPIAAGDIMLAKTPDNPVQYGAEWIILDPKTGVYEIVVVNAIDLLSVTLNAGATLNWPAGTFMFPLLFGRLAQRPQFDGETDELLSGRIGFQENSPYSRRLNIYPGAIPVVGAGVPDFSTKPLFNIAPDEETKMIDSTEVDILYRAIGFLRRDQQYVYPQAVRRGLELNFYQDSRDNIAAITRFFVDRYGTTKTFMCPTFRGDLRLTQNLPEGSADHIDVEPSSFTDPARPTNPGDPYIALIGPNGVVDPQEISSIVGNTLHLASAVTQSHKMADTKLSHLLLSAFAEPKLNRIYKSDGQCECKLKIIEVPDEYEAPRPDLPEPVYYYVLTEQMPTPLVTRFTSYEQSIVLAGTAIDGTYPPGPFDHGDIETGIKLDEEKVEVTSFDFSSTANPLRKMLEYSLEGILHIDIYEGDRNTPGAEPDLFFSGDSAALVPNGKDWKATFRAFGQFFARQFPRFNFQAVCAVPLFSPKCGLDRSGFLTDGTLFAFAIDGSYIDIAQIGGHPDPAAKPAHYFMPGRFETGAGANYEQRMITDSTIVGGKVRLFFSKPLLKSVVNQVVNIYPGCDGSVASCRDKFNNLINMRAHPYIPYKNPMNDIGNVDVASGGKK